MLSEITKKRIELQFEKFAKEFPELAEQVREEKNEETRFLLQYLYANMPQGDVADCPIETCLSFARHGSLLMQEDLWEMLTSDCGNQEENEEICGVPQGKYGRNLSVPGAVLQGTERSGGRQDFAGSNPGSQLLVCGGGYLPMQ